MKAPPVDTCYNLFLNYVYFLGVTPRRNRRTKKRHYALTSVVFLLITAAMFVMSFYYRFNTPGSYQGVSTGKIISKLLFDLIVILGLIRIGLALKTCLNGKDWNTLYENLDALKSPDKCCGKDTRIVLWMFILGQVSHTCTLAIHIKVIYLETEDALNVVLLSTASVFIFYHSSAIGALILLILMEIERELNEIRRKYLTIVNIKMARMVYSKLAIAAKMFNRIFAYQLLIIYFQWIIAIEIMFLQVVFVSVGDDFLINYLSLSETLVIALANTLQIFFGPCAIAFSCDSVTSEADKLLAACQESQEIFDSNSSEYRELESLCSYINTKVIRFTAANFVEVKRSTLLSIVASAATYFVALVQFY